MTKLLLDYDIDERNKYRNINSLNWYDRKYKTFHNSRLYNIYKYKLDIKLYKKFINPKYLDCIKKYHGIRKNKKDSLRSMSERFNWSDKNIYRYCCGEIIFILKDNNIYLWNFVSIFEF